jgi:hypothetical protein
MREREREGGIMRLRGKKGKEMSDGGKKKNKRERVLGLGLGFLF